MQPAHGYWPSQVDLLLQSCSITICRKVGGQPQGAQGRELSLCTCAVAVLGADGVVFIVRADLAPVAGRAWRSYWRSTRGSRCRRRCRSGSPRPPAGDWHGLMPLETGVPMRRSAARAASVKIAGSALMMVSSNCSIPSSCWSSAYQAFQNWRQRSPLKGAWAAGEVVVMAARQSFAVAAPDH